MDEKFLQDLKSFNVDDIIQDQRPTTASTTGNRLSSARPGSVLLTRLGTAGASRNAGSTMSMSDNNEIANSFRPESALFNFSFSRPRTGFSDSIDTFGTSSNRRASLSGRSGWDTATGNGVNDIRPLTSSFNANARAATANRKRASSAATNFDESGLEYIPDLDDVQEEDLAGTVASAPAYELQKMASLKELDADLMQSKPFSVVDGVDLRKLCRFLVPEKELVEDDDPWDWDHLYSEVMSNPDYSHMNLGNKKDKHGQNDNSDDKADAEQLTLKQRLEGLGVGALILY